MSAMIPVLAEACSTSTNPEITALRAYADPATQTTLQGLSEDNLAKYTQNGNTQFKAAVTQDLLDKVSAQINSQLGTFVSATFSGTEKQDRHHTGRHQKHANVARHRQQAGQQERGREPAGLVRL